MKKAGFKLLVGTALTTATLGVFAPANAATIDFIGSPNNTAYSSPHTFTASGYSVVGSAINSVNPFVSSNAWNTEQLFYKHGGGNENGVGIHSDPSGDNEIYNSVKSSTDLSITSYHFIQIDTSLARAAGVGSFTFSMGSTSGTEAWTVYGSNGTGPGASLTALYTNKTTDGVTYSLTDYKYYDFFFSGKQTASPGDANVLLHTLSGAPTPTPIPAALPLFAGGLGMMGFLARRRKRSVASA